MTAMQPTPEVILVDTDDCVVDAGNIRPQHRITPARIMELAASIKQTQSRGGGYYGTGVERPICVYQNGTNQWHVPEGQERLLAMRHLRATDRSYNYTGIPAVSHVPPTDIWASTRFQMSHHNSDPVDPISLTQRAVELKQSALPNGQPATWQAVVDVMGGSASLWSHYQHMLALTDQFQQAVVDREIRPQNAAIIGRDLPEQDLQTRFYRELMAVATNKVQIEATIQRIRRQVAAEALIEAKTEETDTSYEMEDDAEEDEIEAPSAEIDKEAAFLFNQVFKALTRLEILGGEQRLAGTGDEIAQIIERFKNLNEF